MRLKLKVATAIICLFIVGKKKTRIAIGKTRLFSANK